MELYLSLVIFRMDPARSLERVQARVDEVPAVERAREGLGTGVVLRWQVLLFWHLLPVALVRSLVQQVLLQSLVWVLDFFRLCWEVPWDNVLFLNLSHVVLDFAVDLSVELSVLSHLL